LVKNDAATSFNVFFSFTLLETIHKIQTKRKMISLFKYIEKYGNFNFYEKKFTEVDNVILSALDFARLTYNIIIMIMLTIGININKNIQPFIPATSNIYQH